MEWKLETKYLKKEFNGEELFCIELSNIKIKENEENEEIKSIILYLYIKKTINNELCIFADNTLLTKITNIIKKVHPIMIMALNIIIPIFKPIQCKFDVDNFKILELFLNKQSININDLLSSLSNNDFTNFNQFDKLFNINMFSNNILKSVNEENQEKEKEEEYEEEENEEENEEEKENEYINKKPDNLLNMLNNKNIINNFNNLKDTFNIKDILNKNTDNKLNNNLFSKINKIWTNDYYDDNENLDDYLISNNNDNLTRYLKLNKTEISLELNLGNIKNYSANKKLLNELINQDLYNKCIESDINIPGINKWTEIDSDGNKYIMYCFKDDSDKRSFKYENLEQIKNILCEFIDWIEIQDNY